MQRTVHTLIGKSGSGKTTLLRKLIRDSSRCLVFDALANFNYGVISSSQYDIRRYLEENEAENPERKFRVIYRPDIDIAKRSELSESADWLCMVARSIGNCEIFFDEIDSFSSGSDMPEQLDVLVRFGRNIGISMHAAVRRPKVVIPRHWISETTRWSIFQVTDPLDSSFIEEATRIPRDTITRLPRYRYILVDEGIIKKETPE